MTMWIEHSASIEKTVMRRVVCEECDCEFVYEMTITGSGQSNSSIFSHGTAPKEAKKQAKKQFQEEMKYGCKALPCPECAHFQDHMISQAKWDKTSNLFTLGGVGGAVIALVGLFFLGSTATKPFGLPVLVIGVLAGAAVCGAAAFIHSSYDPNKLPEKERFKLAEDNTIPRSEFEDICRDKYAADFEKLCKKLDLGKNPKLEVAGQFFADLDQVDEECRLKAELPNGEPVRVQLNRKMKTGEEFIYEHEHEGHTIEFEYRLLVYTETRVKKN